MWLDAETEEARKSIDVNSISIIISATRNRLLIMKLGKQFICDNYIYRCKKKNEGARVIYNNEDEEVLKMRQPFAVYCKYDVSHSFTSVDDCN